MAKKNQTSFDKDKQPKPENRKPRGKSKSTLMLDAIRAQCGDEKEFLIKVVKAALGDELADPPIPPNAQLMTLVLQRIEAPLKATSPRIEFDLPIGGTPVDKAMSIVDSISGGIIPVDIGKELISLIKDCVIIEEGTDLKARIELIEKALNV